VYKEPAAIIHHLVDIVSKNGCLLLNIGPKSDGTIPHEEQEILREIGRWLSVNGEAIYGTRPWKVFGEGPTKLPAGQFSDNDVIFNGQDIRFTTKGKKLYAITLGEPGEEVEIKSLAGENIRTVKILGFETALSWSQNETGLRIQIQKNKMGRHALVFEITIE
jgi:alpha-L-fucosidase